MNIEYVNIDPEKNRIITLVTRDKEMFFAVIIRRHLKDGVTNYCLYRSLSVEDYLFFAKVPTIEEDFSFFGITDPILCVPKQYSDAFLVTQPEYFIGTHITYHSKEEESRKFQPGFVPEWIEEFVESVEDYKEALRGQG